MKKNKRKIQKTSGIIQTRRMLEAQRIGLAHFDNLKNTKNLEYTAANSEHYPNPYKWDLSQTAQSRAILGDPDGAAQDLKEIFRGMHSDGFIPNVRFINGRYWDPERKTFNDENESSYTQPPLEAQTAIATYNAYVEKGEEAKGREFLTKIFDDLHLSYDYFINYRENGDGSELIGIIHPHETGRDSGPEYDAYVKQGRLPTLGADTPKLVGYVNSAIDYAKALTLNFKLKQVNWDPKLAREKKIFWANDVMFNAMYAKNLYDMAQISDVLGETDKKAFYDAKASKVENEILTKMWDGKMFYSLDINGKMIKKITVGNLAAIMLPNISEEQSKAILDVLSDTKMFATEYPIPSVPVKSPDYDPHFREKRLWRGPTWVNMDFHIVEGLLYQAEKLKETNPQLAQELKVRGLYRTRQVTKMVDREGFWEFYDPETGKGYRITPFAWSGMAKALEYKHQEYLDKAYQNIFDVFDQAWEKQLAINEAQRIVKLKNPVNKILAKI